MTTVVSMIKAAYLAEVVGTLYQSDNMTITVGTSKIIYRDSLHPADDSVDTFQLLSPAESQSGNEAVRFTYTIDGTQLTTPEVDLLP